MMGTTHTVHTEGDVALAFKETMLCKERQRRNMITDVVAMIAVQLDSGGPQTSTQGID